MVALSQIRRLTIEGRATGMDVVRAELEKTADAQRVLIESSNVVAISSDASAKRVIGAAGAFDRVKRAIDPAHRAQEQFARGAKDLTAALAQGIGVDEFGRNLDLLAQKYGVLAAAEEKERQRLSSLREAFDPVYASSQRLSAELDKLAELERSGIQITGGYTAALDGLVQKYDAVARSAAEAAAAQANAIRQARADQDAENARQIAANNQQHINGLRGVSGPSAVDRGAGFAALEQQQRLIEEGRAAQATSDSQSMWNSYAGLRDISSGSARASAAVWEEGFREQERAQKLLADAFEETAKEAAAFETRLAEIRAEIDPLQAAQLKLNAAVAEYRNLAAQPGGLSADEEAKAIRQATVEYEALERQQKARRAGLDYGQMSYQFNDIVTMGLGGAPLSQIAATQGGQIFQVLQQAEGGVRGGLSTLKEDLVSFAGVAARFFTPGGAILVGLTAAAGAAVVFGRSATENLEKANKAAEQYAETLRRVTVGQRDLAGGIDFATERAGRLNPMQSRAAMEAELARQRDALKAAGTSFAQTAVEGVSGSWNPYTSGRELVRQLTGETSSRDVVALAQELAKSADNAEDVRAKLDMIRANPDLADPIKELVDQLDKSAAAAITARERIKGLEEGLLTMRAAFGQSRVTDGADAFREFMPPVDRTAEEEIRRQTQIRIQAANDRERAERELAKTRLSKATTPDEILRANNDLSDARRRGEATRLGANNDEKKALDELARKYGEVQVQRELAARSIGDLTLAQRAQIAAEQELIGSNAPGADSRKFADAADAARARVYAQGVADAAEAERQATAARSQAGLDGYAAQVAAINVQYERQIALADGSAEAVSRLARARDLEIETLSVNTRRDLFRPQEDQLRSLQLEATLIGANDNVRRAALTTLQAESELRRAGIDLNSEIGRGYVDNARKLSDFDEAIRRQNDAWATAKRSGEDMIDSLVDGISSGSFKVRDILGNMTKDFAKSFLELGVANPLKNKLLGTNYGTLDDLFADAPKAPGLDMPGFSTLSSATINAAVVNIGGTGISDLLGSGGSQNGAAGAISKLIGDANDNGKTDRILDHASARVSGAFDLTSVSDSAVAKTLRLHPERAGVAQYFADGAVARGMDPHVTLRGINQESGFNIAAQNLTSREQSYGVAQLNTMGGLGAVAMKQGINVRDPSTWRQQADFALDTMKQDGHRQWYGFRDVGIGRWDGIDRNGGTGMAAAGKALDKSSASLSSSVTSFTGEFGSTVSAFGQSFSSNTDVMLNGMKGTIGSFLPQFGNSLSSLISSISGSTGISVGTVAASLANPTGSLGFFADGGIMTKDGPVPLRMYSGGGIANSPQAAIFGEGSVPEAYVPVPSGRIPVEMRMPVSAQQGGGDTFGAVSISSASVINIDARGADKDAVAEMEQRLEKRLRERDRDLDRTILQRVNAARRMNRAG